MEYRLFVGFHAGRFFPENTRLIVRAARIGESPLFSAKRKAIIRTSTMKKLKPMNLREGTRMVKRNKKIRFPLNTQSIGERMESRQ